MITNISLVTVYCLDQDKARDFYVDVLGFEAGDRHHHGRGLPLGHRPAPEPARARGHPDDARARRWTPTPPTSSAASWRRARWAGSA